MENRERGERPRRGGSSRTSTGKSVWRIVSDESEQTANSGDEGRPARRSGYDKFAKPERRTGERRTSGFGRSSDDKPRSGRGAAPARRRYSDTAGDDFPRRSERDNGERGTRGERDDRRTRSERGERSERRERGPRNERSERGERGTRGRFTNERERGNSGRYDDKPKRRTRYSEDEDSNFRTGYSRSGGKSSDRRAFDKPAYGDRRSSRFSDESQKPRGKFSSAKKSSYEKSVETAAPKSKDGLIRLNKFIANSGVCSRREADEYIVTGLVTVNGTVVTELGSKVKPDDEVRFNNERLKGEKKVYLVLNKPKNYITTTDDPHAKHTVMELIEGACNERVYPVGRLDRNTTGVLLFTNDGELASQLSHPSHNKLKVYQVGLDRDLTKRDMQALVDGVELEDGLAMADAVDYTGTSRNEVGIEIHSGRNRVIRRMFETLGYEISKLDRSYFAGLTKKGLRRGEWRILTPTEVEMLKRGAYE